MLHRSHHRSCGQPLNSLISTIQELTDKIRCYDKAIKELGEQNYPDTVLLRQVKGVGPVTSLAYVLTIADPKRFTDSRAVGAFLGAVPRQDDSGEHTSQLRISRAGNPYLRRLMVGSAQYILGPFGPDTDLQRDGRRLMQRGGIHAKNGAVVAVARKLAILLHRLWTTGEAYEPLRNSHKSVKATEVMIGKEWVPHMHESRRLLAGSHLTIQVLYYSLLVFEKDAAYE